MIILGIIFFLFIVAAFCSVKFLPLNVFGKSICRINDSQNIFLTFDDGPNPIVTPRVLDLLEKHNQKATFFCIARKAEKSPRIIKRIIADGHTLASHDLEHNLSSNFRLRKQMLKQIGESIRILENISGVKIKFYRPPVGLSNPHLFSALKALDLQCVGWTKSVCDAGNRRISAIKKLPQLSNVKNGDIILIHDDAPSENAGLFFMNLEKLLLNLAESEKKSVGL